MTPPPSLSPLEALLEQDDDLYDDMKHFVWRKVNNPADVEDIAQEVIRVAVKRERLGNGWTPESGQTALRYLGAIVPGVLANFRRRGGRKKTSSLENPGWVASEGPSPQDLAEESSERATLVKLARQLRDYIAKKSQTLYSLGILDAAAEGIEAHAEIADRLKCTVAEVENARKRLARYAKAMAEGE